MKKILLGILFVGFILNADEFDDGLKAYQSGNKTKAKKFYGKACDLGNNAGCKEYRILNEQGY